jgi:hypothetical protein
MENPKMPGIGAQSHEKLAGGLAKSKRLMEKVVADISSIEAEVQEVHKQKIDELSQYHEGKGQKPNVGAFDKKMDKLKRRLQGLGDEKDALAIAIQNKGRTLRLNRHFLEVKEFQKLGKQLGKIRQEHEAFRTMAENKLKDFESEELSLARECQRLEVSTRTYAKGEGAQFFPDVFKVKSPQELKAEHQAAVDRRSLSDFQFRVGKILENTPMAENRPGASRWDRINNLFNNYGRSNLFGKAIGEIAGMKPSQFEEFCKENMT